MINRSLHAWSFHMKFINEMTTLVTGFKLEGDVGSIVSLQAERSPYF